MRRFCERLREEGPEALRGAGVEAHLEACPECRAQLEVDALLRGCLPAPPGDAIPAGLEARILERLLVARPVLAPRARIVLGGYWAAALLASLHVLVAWEPVEIGPRLLGVLLAVVAASLSPLAPLLGLTRRRGRAAP